MSKQVGSEKSPTYPFGTYDIFSYVIPGATVLLGIINFEYWYHEILPDEGITPVFATIIGPAQRIAGDHTIYALAYATALLSVVYVCGHLVSSISSFFLDRIYVAKAQGYPHETLLFLPRKSGFRRPDSKGFYQGFFFWLNLYLILRFTSFFYSTIWLWRSLNMIETLMGIAIIIKLIASTLRSHSKWNLYRWLNKKGQRWMVDSAKFFLANVFPLPFIMLSRSIEGHVRTGRVFESELRERYLRSFAEKFKLDPLNAGSNNFWMCKMYVASRSPEFNANLSYWLDMYTYARNLSTAFYSSFLYAFAFVYLQYPFHRLADRKSLFIIMSIPFGYLLLAGVLAVRFRYIYVGYYNSFLFRSFIFLCGVAEPETVPGGENAETGLGTEETLGI